MKTLEKWWQGLGGLGKRRFIYLRMAVVWRVEWVQGDDHDMKKRDFYREDAARDYVEELKTKAGGAWTHHVER